MKNKIFFIGQNSKRVHLTYSFNKLSVFFWSALVDFFQFDFLLNPRNIECKFITPKGTDQEIESKKYIFLLVLDADGRIHVF